jgi:hypothetical protein
MGDILNKEIFWLENFHGDKPYEGQHLTRVS